MVSIESAAIDSIQPYPGNPRVNEAGLQAVVASIRAFGFRQPIVVDADRVIVVGHTRWRAARELGLEQVPVHVAADLSADEARAYRLADNRTAELATWDEERLAAELLGLRESGAELDGLGWGLDELAELIGEQPAGGADPDEVPEPPDDPETQRGDLWILGEHRLLCGDSADAGDLERLLAGERVQLVHTDPPYNVAVQPRTRAATGSGGKLRARDRPIANDAMPEAEFRGVLEQWFARAADALEPGRAIYAWGGHSNAERFPAAFRSAGLHFSQVIVWVKEHPVANRQDFMSNHEWAFYGWREGAPHVFHGEPASKDVWYLERAGEAGCAIGRGVRLRSGDGAAIDVLPPAHDRRIRELEVGDAVHVSSTEAATDVWSVRKVSPAAMVHVTEKPVELPIRAMRFSTKPGELVLDLFGGSGSTLIGAEVAGRRARLVELDEAYCDVIVRRWEQVTGGKAERRRADG